MAKSFNEVIKVKTKSAYGELDNVLILAAMLNEGVQFKPTLSPNGTRAEEKYVVHVAKRNKSKTIGAAGDVTTSTSRVQSMTTADNLKILDSFGEYDWDSDEITTGLLRGIGHKIGFNDEYQADSQSQVQQDYIATEIGNMAITRKELLIEAIVKAGSANPMTVIDESKIGNTGTTLVHDAVTAQVRAIRKITNDFKHRTAEKDILILMDTEMKDAAAKEIGTSFNQEAPIYKTKLKSKFSVAGYPVVEVPELDQFLVDTDKGVKMVVLDVEAMAFMKANEMKGVDVNLGATRFVGNLFYDITHVMSQFADRIAVTKTTAAATKVKSVNE